MDFTDRQLIAFSLGLTATLLVIILYNVYLEQIGVDMWAMRIDAQLREIRGQLPPLEGTAEQPLTAKPVKIQ